MSSSPEPTRLRRIRSSALWAAYGDALGFISELADAKLVERRGAHLPLMVPVNWTRRVGGKFGSPVDLPAGCISDDTQLRLATCRSISGDGAFDVETFSKIELPIWASYALGAGRGSQEAAANLRRRDVTWATNFFEADRSVYVNAGGNGAAMRVQPHAWAAPAGANPDRWHTDVIVNSVCTHGHLRGILGALFHAICVSQALDAGTVPGPAEWDKALAALGEVPRLIRSHDLLDHLWLGLWEQRASNSLDDAMAAVIKEIRDSLTAVSGNRRGAEAYESAVQRLAAFKPEDRGSGTKTAVLGAIAAHLFASDPAGAIRIAANRLGTDTDSIATMAGAIVGATVDELPEVPIADRAYIERESERMWAIGDGRAVPNFPYPSIVSWSAPRTQVDTLALTENGQLAVAGLGPATVHGEEIVAGTENKSGALGWVDLWFGQRLLIRRRTHPHHLQKSQSVSALPEYTNENFLEAGQRTTPPTSPALTQMRLGENSKPAPPTAVPVPPRSLHEITDEVIRKGLTAEAVGEGLLEVAGRSDGIELAGQYGAILAKAILARQDRARRK